MTELNQLAENARELGAGAAAVVKTADLKFSEEFRTLCQQNACGKYGTNWMCPPAVGTFEASKAKVLRFAEGVVFQTVYRLEDSFDYDGMVRAGEIHERLFRRLLEHIQRDVAYAELLPLNAGECKACRHCTYPDGKPCRSPDKAVASIEAHGIDVNALVTHCGIPYNHGPDTVALVGLFLFQGVRYICAE